jgi:hypothetical protein
MPLDYKTLPAQWKKVKPLTMGTTGIGPALKNITGFNWKDITEVEQAARWKSNFDVAMKGLDAATEKAPLKSDAKTKGWVEKLLREIMNDANNLNRIHVGLLVYDPVQKKWVSASEAQSDAVDQLDVVKAAWLKLKPETRRAIMKLVRAG